MANNWYVSRDGKNKAGPYSAQQLKQLAASGKLRPTDLVRQDGMAKWLPAQQIQGLFPGPSSGQIPTATPVPPPSPVHASGQAAESSFNFNDPGGEDDTSEDDFRVPCWHCGELIIYPASAAGTLPDCPDCGKPTKFLKTNEEAYLRKKLSGLKKAVATCVHCQTEVEKPPEFAGYICPWARGPMATFRSWP